MFYFGPVEGLTLGVDVRAGQGHYWHIYHSQAVPVAAKEEPDVPYLHPNAYPLLCRWKKTDNISVLRLTLCPSLLVGPKSLLQMDMGSKS